ncbi:MAG: selenium-dependent xanthine dehydrogenase [Oscillospiraceae bacterium]|nr:selenium-dependent xanthine dehydrogenase [Oscillospiraceae bacterium]
MASFTVNGRVVAPSKNQKLLRFLRDELHLTAAKDGCSEGACGACTVIINGEICKSCVPDTDALEGMHIVTVEGLTEWEKQVYSFAYAEAGAVQCGFCIPGMVLCSKALLDKNPDPTEPEIRYALRNNYCRCTGYVKIVAAVKLAAQILRDGVIPKNGTDDWQLGSRVQRLDADEKVLGIGKYPDDYYPDGMLYGSALRSKYARARVLSIDTAAAKALPGVAAVLTADDIPGENKIGHLKHDQYTLIPAGGLTHYLGDAIALVAAVDRETLEKAKKLIQVVYEELPAVHNIKEAAAPDAPRVFDEEKDNSCAFKHVSRGNADEAIRHSAHVLSHHFETPWTEHAFLEPECAVAYIDGDGDVFVYSTDQSAHQTLHECKLLLGSENVKVQNALVGGGFGGKEDMTVQHHAALLAYLTRRPVKVKLTRAESLLIHPKRHHFEMDFTMGCDENGIIQGVKAKVFSDTGAFASLGGPVLERACTHAAGPYTYQNFEIEGTAFYTNNPPAGAFRGFGVTQTCFVTESLLNMMADEVGISPWEIHYRNAIRPWGVLPNGQIVDDSTGLVETLEAIKPDYDAAVAAGKPVGIGCAMKNAGVGVGIPDTGRVKLIVEPDQKVHIYSGASCIGQGLGTVLVQMVVSNTDLARDDIVYERSNTWIAPDSGTTSGSRQTLVTGEACRRACEKLMEDRAAGKTLRDMVGSLYYGEYLAKTDSLGADLPNPMSHVAYGYATQVCILDPKTGKIEKMIAAHDVGKAVNPLSCEGQIEGGVVMSMGFALREQYPIDENCKPIEKFGSLGLFRAHELPEIKAIVVDKPGLQVACGAIGIGEITSIPTAPAIADAYFRYDHERRYSLPLTHTPYERKDGA